MEPITKEEYAVLVEELKVRNLYEEDEDILDLLEAYLSLDLETQGYYIDDKLVGILFFDQATNEMRNGDFEEGELLEISAVYVHPDFRRQGIASKMIQEVLNEPFYKWISADNYNRISYVLFSKLRFTTSDPLGTNSDLMYFTKL